MRIQEQPTCNAWNHSSQHAFQYLNALNEEGIVVRSRRNMLKASMQGIAGLSIPLLLKSNSDAIASGTGSRNKKSVILLWMTGGPSQIDTWDPKPDRPLNNRGPFGTIPTKLPGVRICEHLPKQAFGASRSELIWRRLIFVLKREVLSALYTFQA